MKLTIVSGRSGSGKTVSLHVLEDLGYYCVDNLPIQMLPLLAEELLSKNTHMAAISIDVRNAPQDTDELKKIMHILRAKPDLKLEVLYLDASENILLKRFSETRRKHPLTNTQISLREAIQTEQHIISPVSDQADLTIDTTNLSSHQLCQIIRGRCSVTQNDPLNLLLQSFGFKHGIPPEADFVFDTRFLPNPYWVPELRPLTGLDEPVIQFLQSKPQVEGMIKELHRLMQFCVPEFQADNRSYLTIAVGCTGGCHRSVYIVERLAKMLTEIHPHLQIRHRDLKRGE